MKRAFAFLTLVVLIQASASASPPNLVIFLSDDHSQLDATPYGATDVATPSFERIAKEGMLFTHAFVASPTCAPSRGALLTGLAPARNGAEENHARVHSYVRKLPSYLQALGYEVVAFGKVAHYRHTPQYGFDHFEHDGFHDHAGIGKSIDYLAGYDGEKPLCLFVGSNWPHVPWPEDHPGYDPAEVGLHPKYVDTPEMRTAQAQYYAAVTNMDREMGQVYDAARKRFGDDFIFFHSSDHGAQLPFHKWNLYDAGIRVAAMAVWPGTIPTGSRSDAMIQWTDVLPTLIDLAGGEPEPDLDGVSFAPVLRGEADSHHDWIFTTHSGDKDFNVYPMRSVRGKRWKYIRNLHPEFQYATHINRHAGKPALIYWRSWERAAESDPDAAATIERFRTRPPEELYDLDSDPFEENNLAGNPEQAERLKAMAALVDRWMEDTGDRGGIYGKPLMRDEDATLIETPVRKRKKP